MTRRALVTLDGDPEVPVGSFVLITYQQLVDLGVIGGGLPEGGTAADYLDGEETWQPTAGLPISDLTQTALTTLTGLVTAEASTRLSADQTLAGQLNTESITRSNADAALDLRVDAKADLVGGKVPSSQIPSVAITEVFPVANQAAMLALTAERGDVAIRADNARTYILSTDSPSTLADWLLLPDANSVVSVNGHAGVVVLGAADVEALASSAASAQGLELLAATTQADARTAIAAQRSDSDLDGFANLGWTVADRMAYSTGSHTFALAALTAYARTLLDDADAATARATLGIPGTADALLTSSGLYTGRGGVRSTATAVQNRLYLHPVVLSSAVTVSSLATEVVTLAASSTVRLGIYADSGGLPGALIVDAGTVASTSTGLKEIAISQALAAGTYWLAIVAQGGQPVLRTVGTGGPWQVPIADPSGASSPSLVYASAISGALPSTPTIALTVSNCPCVWIKT